MSISAQSLVRLLRRHGFNDGLEAIEAYGERVSNLGQIARLPGVTTETIDAVEAILIQRATRNQERHSRQREDFLRFSSEYNYEEMARMINTIPTHVLNMALYNAVDSGDNYRVLIEYLLDNGANPLSRNMAIFEMALKKGTQDIVDLFYGYGVTPDQHDFFVAAIEGDLEKVRNLYMEGGSDTPVIRRRLFQLAEKYDWYPGSKDVLRAPDVFSAGRLSALYYAASAGNDDIVAFLRDQSGDYISHVPYLIAAIASETELIAMTDRVNFDHTYLNNMLLSAAGAGRGDNVKRLLSLGANAAYEDYEAIGLAAGGGFLDVVKILETRGGYKDHRGIALVAAAAMGQIPLLRYLITVEPIDYNNHRAVALAAENGHFDAVEFLIERGGNASVDDNYPIIAAAEEGDLDLFRALHRHGADVNARGGHPLYFATENGHENIISYIRAVNAGPRPVVDKRTEFGDITDLGDPIAVGTLYERCETFPQHNWAYNEKYPALKCPYGCGGVERTLYRNV